MTSKVSPSLSITLRKITKLYARTDKPAVDSVDLVVAPSEFVTLLGPSGSGKTTILNMIAGFVQPTSGTVHIGDNDVSKLPANRRNIGVVFQHYALFPHMSIARNISFPLEQRKYKKSQIDRRVKDTLRTVQLNGAGHLLPRQLSGGQQQRVALARAIVFNPGVLLMDEPLGALDKKLREELRDEISRMCREFKVTVLFVTHDQEEALALSDRVAIVNNGRIEQVGTPEALYRSPGSIFVAEFLGESNILRGHYLGDQIFKSGESTFLVPEPSDLLREDECALMVRPEDLDIRPIADTLPAQSNALETRVTDISYLGPSRRLLLDFGDRAPGVVRKPASDSDHIQIGDKVHIIWPIEAGTLVRDSASMNG